MIDYAIVVLSCDKYSSLWPGFFGRLNKHWVDSPADIFLVTNHLEPKLPNVSNLAIGDDVDWSANLLNALSRINAEYVYIILEDVFINKDIDHSYFKTAMDFIDSVKPNYLNTRARPKARGPRHGRLVRELVKGTHCRASVTNAFWRKDMLLTLLAPGESPWEFERRGSERSNSYAGFYGMAGSMLEYHHIIIGGRVARDVLNIKDVIDTKILEDFPILGRWAWFLFQVSLLRNKFFSRIVPQRLQQRTRNLFD